MTTENPNLESLTVSQVEQALIALAKKYQLDDFKQVHKLVGVSDRTLRRWRNKADSAPLEPSNIPYLGAVAVWSLLQGQSVLDVVRDVRESIPREYLTTAENYVCPPTDFLKSLVGKKQLLGLTIAELSSILHCSHVQLGKDIKFESLSYLTFCSLLMLCGFKPSEVFQVGGDSSHLEQEYIYNVDRTVRTRDSLEIYSQRTPEGNDIRVIYLDDVECKQTGEKWVSQGYRWSVCEVAVTEPEAIEWLLNNGLTSVPFLRKDS